MNASGYGDAERLAQARELAQSFKKGQRGDAGPPPTYGKHTQAWAREPQQNPRRTTAVSHCHNRGPPPPSQRKYDQQGKFHRPLLGHDGMPMIASDRAPVLGAAAFEFLFGGNQESKAQTVEPSDVTMKAPAVAPHESATAQVPSQDGSRIQTTQTPTGGKASTPSYHFQRVKPEGIPKGSMLDKFYKIVGQDTQPCTEQVHAKIQAPEPAKTNKAPKGLSSSTGAS